MRWPINRTSPSIPVPVRRFSMVAIPTRCAAHAVGIIFIRLCWRFSLHRWRSSTRNGKPWCGSSLARSWCGAAIAKGDDSCGVLERSQIKANHPALFQTGSVGARIGRRAAGAELLAAWTGGRADRLSASAGTANRRRESWRLVATAGWNHPGAASHVQADTHFAGWFSATRIGGRGLVAHSRSVAAARGAAWQCCSAQPVLAWDWRCS